MNNGPTIAIDCRRKLSNFTIVVANQHKQETQAERRGESKVSCRDDQSTRSRFSRITHFFALLCCCDLTVSVTSWGKLLALGVDGVHCHTRLMMMMMGVGRMKFPPDFFGSPSRAAEVRCARCRGADHLTYIPLCSIDVCPRFGKRRMVSRDCSMESEYRNVSKRNWPCRRPWWTSSFADDSWRTLALRSCCFVFVSPQL